MHQHDIKIDSLESFLDKFIEVFNVMLFIMVFFDGEK